MGRTGRQAVVLGTASLIVVAAGTCVALTRGSGPVAKAATTVSAVDEVTLVTPAGRVSTAHDGQRVPNGDVVRTGPHGSVQLTTRGRVVYVEGSSAVSVLNGAHQQLLTGSAVFDAQHGPGVNVDLADDALAVPGGSATEAFRQVTVQVGSLAGPARITSANGRALAVAALAQTVVSGDSLPSGTTPLRLDDDEAEAHAVPSLVSDDIAMQTLARGIDTSGTSTAQVVDASWTGTTATLPRHTARSEQVLPVVIADAATRAAGTAQDRYDRVVGWRRAGGSWGVVLALLDSDSASVTSMFQRLQRDQPAGQIGTVSIRALAAAPVTHGRAAHHQTTVSGPTSPPTTPPTTPTQGGPTPMPKPSPTTGLVGGLVNTVNGVVGTVLALLPKASTAGAGSPAPQPHPLKSLTSGLLGGLLGHK